MAFQECLRIFVFGFQNFLGAFAFFLVLMKRKRGILLFVVWRILGKDGFWKFVKS